MEPKVTAIVPVPDPKPVQVPQAVQTAQAVQKIADAKKAEAETSRRRQDLPKTLDQGETRLVIEMDEGSGAYVYKTIDRTTGELVSQLPRAEVLKLRDGADYAAGSVVRTKA